MLTIKKNLKILTIFLLIQTLLFGGYSTDISSTARGNSFWGSAILKLKVNKLNGNLLELRITKTNGDKITSAGKFTLREDRHKGNILMSTRTGGYSYYEEFEDIDMSRFNTYPKDLYVYYEPDAGGYAWVGPIRVNYTVDIPSTPSKPSALATTVGARVYISWNAISGATNYKLYRATSANGTYQQIYYASGRSYSDMGSHLSEGTRYYYKLRAGNSAGWSGYSSYQSVTTAVSKPLTPSRPSATVQGTNKVYVSWGSISGAKNYKLYRATSANGSYSQIYYSNGTSYTDVGSHLSSNTTYYYKVRAGNDSGWSDYSSYRSVKTDMAIPSQPTTPSASVRGENRVDVSWGTSVNASKYALYRSPSSTGTYKQIHCSDTLNYNDLGTHLTQNTDYYYKLKAGNSSASCTSNGTGAGWSDFSTYKQVKTAKSIAIVPSRPTAVAKSATEVYVTWSSVAGAINYRLFRSLSPNGTFQQVYYADGTSYTDSGTHLTGDTTYFYKVKSENVNGNSGYSDAVSVTTFPVPSTGFPETVIKTKTSTSLFVDAQHNPFTNTNQNLEGQCTWYAYGRILELVDGGHLAQRVADDFKAGLWTGTGRHAQYWPTKLGIVGEGFSTNTKVLPMEKRKKGLLAIWSSGVYGHVGIVEEVGPNKDWYILSDFNRGDNTNYRRIKYKFDSSANVAGTVDDKLLGVYPTFYELDVLTPTPNNNVVGIDISDANGNVDMNQVKTDNKHIEYLFVKATEGYPEGDDVNHEVSKKYLQSNFTKNMDNALSAGLKVAPYHFARPDYNPTLEDAEQEAIYFVKKIKSYYENNKMLAPMIDIEHPLNENVNNQNQIGRWTKAELSSWILALSNKVEVLLGVKPILYMNENFVNNEVDSSLSSNTLWIAKYNINNGEIGERPSTGTWSKYGFWQYTSKGSVSGITGDVDLNIFNGSVEALTQTLYQQVVVDSDGDSIPDNIEIELGLNPNSTDSDNDGILDSVEIGDMYNPRNSDGTDEIDALDDDSDNDNISDRDEVTHGLNPLDETDANADNDNDGYSNLEEINNGTNLNDASSYPIPESETKTLILRKGFGLYGMNSSMTLTELKEKIGESNLLAINSASKTYQLSYVNDGLGFLNDFTVLEPLAAVWINVSQDVSIDYEESRYSETQELNLNAGKWYLVNPPKVMSLAEIKNQVGANNIDTIQGPVKTYQQQYIDDGMSFLNDFTGFEEPKGYWIKLVNDAILTFEFTE